MLVRHDDCRLTVDFTGKEKTGCLRIQKIQAHCSIECFLTENAHC